MFEDCMMSALIGVMANMADVQELDKGIRPMCAGTMYCRGDKIRNHDVVETTLEIVMS